MMKLWTCPNSRHCSTAQDCLQLLHRQLSHKAAGRRVTRLRAMPAVALLLPTLPALPPPGTAANVTARLELLASVVPNFPRIGGQPVRDWIAQSVEQLPGFNGDDLARLLFPDIVGLVDGPTLVIVWLLVIAFLYWEGGILYKQLRERQRRKREQHQQGGGGGGSSEAADGSSGMALPAAGAAAEQRRPEPPPMSPIERARYERRRGLAWLALAAAASIWMTGVVNGPTPFQP